MKNMLLLELLNAREARAAQQQSLLEKYHCPVVCFTMNIAGPVKTSGLIRRAFDAGLAALEDALKAYPIHSREILHEITGDEAIFSVEAEASALKAACTAIEEASPMGRLFDMDVLDAAGRKPRSASTVPAWSYWDFPPAPAYPAHLPPAYIPPQAQRYGSA